MHRTRNGLVFVIGGTTLFLGGCLVGAAAQQYLASVQVETKSVAQAPAPQPEEPIFAQPLVHKPVRTVVVRADGTFAEPVNN